VFEYVFNPNTGDWDIESGSVNIDPYTDATMGILAAPNDPALSENNQGVAAQVKADIKLGTTAGYTAAINLIISTYGFITTNSSFIFVPTGYIFGTRGYVGTGKQQTVEIPIPYLQAYANNLIAFGSLVRLLGHEYVHVQQKSGANPITDQNLREFLAYVYSLTASGLPAEDAANKAEWKQDMKDAYNQLSPALQQQYKTTYQAALNS
jgi:hypothetical protein